MIGKGRQIPVQEADSTPDIEHVDRTGLDAIALHEMREPARFSGHEEIVFDAAKGNRALNLALVVARIGLVAPAGWIVATGRCLLTIHDGLVSQSGGQKQEAHPVTRVGSAVTISLNGVGIFEAMVIALLSLVGVPTAHGFLLARMVRALFPVRSFAGLASAVLLWRERAATAP